MYNNEGDKNSAKITSLFDKWATMYIGGTLDSPSLQKIDSNHAVYKVNLRTVAGWASKYMKLYFYIYSVNNYYSEYKD